DGRRLSNVSACTPLSSSLLDETSENPPVVLRGNGCLDLTETRNGLLGGPLVRIALRACVPPAIRSILFAQRRSACRSAVARPAVRIIIPIRSAAHAGSCPPPAEQSPGKLQPMESESGE